MRNFLMLFVFLCGCFNFYIVNAAAADAIEIITDKSEYFRGEKVNFTIRGRIMVSQESDGRMIPAPFSIWDSNNQKIQLRHSCSRGKDRLYDEYCSEGMIKTVEWPKCPEVFFYGYERIDESFDWDQKVYTTISELCGDTVIHREIRQEVPPGLYRIVVCGSILNCTEKEIVLKEHSPVSIITNKESYVSGEPVKITIMNNTDKVLFNVDRNISSDEGFPAKNAAWGFVEKFKRGSWVRVEPLWRCGDGCFARCALGEKFFILLPKGKKEFPGSFRFFQWDQKRLFCLPKEKRESVGPGTYRISVSFALRNDENDPGTIFHSEEFKIR